MMNLYEIVNDYQGESYIRAYAWAPTEREALELYRLKNDEKPIATKIRLLFSSGNGPFCTKRTDDGENWFPIAQGYNHVKDN